QRFHCVERLLRVGVRRGCVDGLVCVCVGLRDDRLLRVGLGKSHSGQRDQNNGQHKTKGFHVSFSLRNSLLLYSRVRVIRWRPHLRPFSSNEPPASYTVLYNYNTRPHVKLFLYFPVPAAIRTGQRALVAHWQTAFHLNESSAYRSAKGSNPGVVAQPENNVTEIASCLKRGRGDLNLLQPLQFRCDLPLCT